MAVLSFSLDCFQTGDGDLFLSNARQDDVCSTGSRLLIIISSSSGLPAAEYINV